MDSLTTRFNKEVFAPYLDLLKTGYRFHRRFAHAERSWSEKLTMTELVNGPYMEKAQAYASGKPLETLALHERTKATIQRRLKCRSLYKHQTDALEIILRSENAVIATGTSSGKTLCYQIPILDDLIRQPSPGLRAIIIYPLNALVNDQLNEWEEMLKEHPQITFARFTGQTPATQLDYQERLRATLEEQLRDQYPKQQDLKREVAWRLEEQLQRDPKNRLNHRDAIRSHPPHVLITNFSMLEYLMERPVDAPVFEGARLKFLVLDEAHAYRGVQATEIAFLVRRLKDRMMLDRLTCIATSATLGKPGDEESERKVRKFASDLFDEDFHPPNPIYGTPAQPQLIEPSFRPTAAQYIRAREALRDGKEEVRHHLFQDHPATSFAALLEHDENLFRLRNEILTKPILLSEAADALWPDDVQAADGLQALLEIVASAKKDEAHEDLLPTRLHYFVRAQDGLHLCLHRQCPGRLNGEPAFFVTRKSNDTPEGLCPACYAEGAGWRSKLVEVVTCRKCGYLYGALQDLGPRRARNSTDGPSDTPKPQFDSFDTELGWAADSFWSYFSVENDLPYPRQSNVDEDDEEQDDLFNKSGTSELDWCVICGKKNDQGVGDNCLCDSPHLRRIQVFHRQCPYSVKAKDNENLSRQEKKLLTSCPNCEARNGSGLEPVRRFQESDDETGLAMAIPLSHFQVTPHMGGSKPPRKLLCFTDHRQRAAAFPSLLEEETFAHDMGRKIVEVVHAQRTPLDFVALGERLADFADRNSDDYDPDFFLPFLVIQMMK